MKKKTGSNTNSSLYLKRKTKTRFTLIELLVNYACF